MNYHTPAQMYYHTASKTIHKQQVHRQKIFDFAGGMMVWRAVGRIFLFCLPVIFSINLCLTFYLEKIETSIQVAEGARFEIMNDHIILRAQKARLMSPEYVQIAAAEKLSLHVPRIGQVKHF